MTIHRISKSKDGKISQVRTIDAVPRESREDAAKRRMKDMRKNREGSYAGLQPDPAKLKSARGKTEENRGVIATSKDEPEADPDNEESEDGE